MIFNNWISAFAFLPTNLTSYPMHIVAVSAALLQDFFLRSSGPKFWRKKNIKNRDRPKWVRVCGIESTFPDNFSNNSYSKTPKQFNRQHLQISVCPGFGYLDSPVLECTESLAIPVLGTLWV